MINVCSLKKIDSFTPDSEKNMRERYVFDTEHLVYIPEKRTFRYYLKQSRKLAVAALSVGVAAWILMYANVLPSVEALILENKSNKYISNIQGLDEKFSKIETFLSEIQYHDDSCYRALSKLEPLSQEKRKASFGGVNRYENLEGYFNSNLFIVYNRKVDILEKKLSFQEQSYDAVVNSIKRIDDSLLSVPAIIPINPSLYRVSSSFGWRVHPISNKRIHHDGLDLALNVGNPVYSSGKGVVTMANVDHGYGKQIIIDHGYGYKTRYAHLSKISVHVGDTVYRGDLIGTVGNTGISTGPHLHYEVITPSGRLNPELFFSFDLTETEYEEMLVANSRIR